MDCITAFDLTDGDELMEQTCASDTCRSCQSAVSNGCEVCDLCKDFVCCLQCTSWLPFHRFIDGSVIRDTCEQRQVKKHKKSAFGGIVQEVPIPCSETDVDYGEFLRSHAHTIENIVQQGLNQHM